MAKPIILIGIDPGTKTGLCVYNTYQKEIKRLMTTKIHTAMEIITNIVLNNSAVTHVVIEDARMVRFATSSAKAQGAGSVKRDVKILEDFLDDLNASVSFVRPTFGAKMDAKTFKKMTGWQEKTSSHARDAALLVWGK